MSSVYLASGTWAKVLDLLRGKVDFPKFRAPMAAERISNEWMLHTFAVDRFLGIPNGSGLSKAEKYIRRELECNPLRGEHPPEESPFCVDHHFHLFSIGNSVGITGGLLGKPFGKSFDKIDSIIEDLK